MQPLSNPVISRRALLAGAAAVAAGAATLPASAWARVPGANDRLRVGVIGVGGRGRYLAQLFHRHPDVQVAALCDAYDDAVRQTTAALGGGSVRRHADYRALLDDAEIDAVVIGTPDHWHAAMVVDACRAGKDVYVEKPLAHTIEEGRAMVRAARETGRTVQVGLQQRSGPHYLQAKREIFDSGRIGRVGYVRTWWHGNASRLLDPARNRRPEGLDWEAWLGPARRRRFDPRLFYQWRQYADFGEGMVGDLFTHWVDVVHWYMGEDLPAAATAMGGIHHFRDGRDWPDHVHVLLEYPGGWSCSFEGSIAPGARGAGIEFMGEKGRLLIDRSQYTWTPAEPRDAPSETVRATGDQTVEHVRNFVASVRARTAPSSDVLSGHRSTLAAHLGNRAYLRRARVQLDPREEERLA